MYNASLIAKYIINYSNSKGKSVSNLRLQKILYFVQAEFLVSKNECCFSDDIYAWDLGPVVPSVYREYKMFGSSSIPSQKIVGIQPLDEDKTIINEMVDECNKISTYELVQITHNQTPWKKAYEMPYNNGIISPESIKEYFNEA